MKFHSISPAVFRPLNHRAGWIWCCHSWRGRHWSAAASHMAMNLAGVVSSIGALVSWDDQPGKRQAGSFRSGYDVSDLMTTTTAWLR